MSNHYEIPDPLLKRCAGRTELAERIIARFLEQMAEDLPKLGELVLEQDCEAVRRTAHRLKGAAASVAAEEVRANAAELEKVAAASLVDELQPQLDMLHETARAYQELTSSLVAG